MKGKEEIYYNFDLQVFICSCPALTWWCVHTVCDEQSWSSTAEDSWIKHTPACVSATEVQHQAYADNGCRSCGSLKAISSSMHSLPRGHYSHHHYCSYCGKYQCGSIYCDHS